MPDLKLGSGAKLKLYGIVKASVIYDTSSPYGTDMPLPGFITASGTSFDPGPTRSPEFHAKARFARVGTNFEWPDVAGSHNAITGKLEFDFEGNFSRTLNRNISTIRSNMASIRLAYGRIDHSFSDQTSMRPLNLGTEEAELERLRALFGSSEETPLKSAMMILVERLKSENPDPIEVAAAMEEVKRLWPESVSSGPVA